jgi:ligand-binding sensor domain-containing protein/signal transduction histidine kinase/CheY-like chemotaxis protein/AraC-like DNA-binding protein
MKRQYKYHIRALFVFLLLNAIAYGQGPKLKFKRIGIEQGLSNSTIENISQDKRGFMWFGTRDGLNRFDGYQMTVYRYHPKDSTTISDNYIRYIHNDREGNLWAGTINGLNQFVPHKNNFIRYKHKPADNRSLSNNLVTCIYEDKAGNLWVSTFGGGLNLLNKKEKTFFHYRHNRLNSNSLSDDRVNCIYEDKRGNLWIGTEKGLNLFDRKTKTFSKQSLGNEAPGADYVIKEIEEDQTGNLWIGTSDRGIYLFNPVTRAFKQFRHIEKDPNSLASNLVRSLLFDKKGNLWVGSINGGLDLYNPSANSFFHYQNEPNDPFSLSQRTSSALFEDNQGNLWVGTHRGGVNLYAPNTEKFRLYQQEQNLNSLSYNDVKAFCEDAQGNIWIGTDGGGLNLFDEKKNSFRHFKYDPFNTRSIGSNEVLHVMEDSEGDIWAGTWGGGLNLLNRSTGSFTRYVNNPSDKNSISSNYVQKIYEDSKKNLWVATYYGGLNLFDKKTKKFIRVVADEEQRTSLFGNNIVSINEDQNGNIWIGTDDSGLNCLNAATRSFFHYFNNEDKLPDLRIIFIDSKGRVWVGQAGLYLFDAQKNTFNLYTDNAGLATEFIKGITEDAKGNFWIATSNGLTQFNPETYSYKKYNTADGLQGLEFEANAYLKTRSGQMFFGGINGFNSFYPDDIKTNSFIPPVYITDFQLFNKKIQAGEKDMPLKLDITLTKKINLSYKQSTFSFGFAALNYTASENNQYAYMLEDWDDDWIYAGSERKASYTNVRPGTYTFRVKASNNDGVWNENGPSIKLIISPPFWATWWFRTLLFVAFAAAVIGYFQFRRKLELRKLEEQKREELHQVQLQFFTNISHEFRTPLSLILGPLERLQKENGGTAFDHYYKVMYRNAKRLVNLINELMDFRKTESGALKLNVMPGNMQLFLNEIEEEFSELAVQKKIDFVVKVPEDSGEVWFDRQILEKIAVNLISNSFKYTENGGSIKVEVLNSMENFKPCFENELALKNNYPGKKYMYLCVSDNGIGISKESIPHLFERYYKISDAHLGSGIGLAFVKSLAVLHKAHIYVYSQRHKGTQIIIGFPVSKEDYGAKERWMKDKEPGVRLESIGSHEYEHPINTSERLPKEKTHNGHAAHILIVDDNDELRRFLKESLSERYHISEAEDGPTGIIKVQEEFPDLIISDVMMPKMDGIEFCRYIKENSETSHIPFLMLTAKDGMESKIEGVASGADYYFAKPVSLQLLGMTIQNILTQKNKLKARYTNEQYSEVKELVHSAKAKEFIEQLIAIIESQLSNPDMNIDYICTQIGMSRTKLYQKVKSITGESIGDFIRTIRLNKAVEIMTKQDVPLTDVMYSVGIQTQSYFTKAFKKKFGKTPSQFLKDLHK